jgi:hypothetical protein
MGCISYKKHSRFGGKIGLREKYISANMKEKHESTGILYFYKQVFILHFDL